MAKDVDVPVVGAHFEIRVVRSVPAIQHFLDYIAVITQLEAKRILVRLCSRVTLHANSSSVVGHEAPSVLRGSAKPDQHSTKLSFFPPRRMGTPRKVSS